MQRETSNDSFLDYGSVYHQPIDREHPELIHQTMVALTRRYVSQFYCFNCDTYLQVKSGIGVLLVSHTADSPYVQAFAQSWFSGELAASHMIMDCRRTREALAKIGFYWPKPDPEILKICFMESRGE